MEFSSSFYKRKEKMSELIIPTFSETKEQLGDDFTQVFCKMCPESLRGEMSLESVLDGPGKELWMSPSDILLNKLVLKPPITERYLKSLTHKGILEIGREIESKYFNVLEQAKYKELKEQEELLLFMSERQKETAIKEAVAREHEMFRRKLMDLNAEFEILLHNELEKMEEYLREIYEKLLTERTEQFLLESQREMDERISQGTKLAVDELTCKFLQDLEKQEKDLTELFDSRLKSQKDRYKNLLQNEQEVFQIILKQLNHNLQCNNIANLMYLLCAERRHCIEDKQQLINMYTEKLERLNIKIDDQKNTIKKLEDERDDKILQCEQREICLKNILKQFQKFINFSLRAAPTQAEFLLDIKKMMTFQLMDTFMTAKQNNNKMRRIKGIMPWKKKSMCSSDEHMDKERDIIAQDFHNCLNEVKVTRNSAGEVDSGTSLQGFLYKKKLYLREDFRNKFSGFAVEPNNMIWNTDVEHFIQLLKKTDKSNSSAKEKSIDSDNSERSNGSVHFTEVAERTNAPQTDSINNTGILGTHDSVVLQKSIRSNKSQHSENVPEPPGIPILGAVDSLTCVKAVGHSKSNMDTEKVHESDIFGEARMNNEVSVDTTITTSLVKDIAGPESDIFDAAEMNNLISAETLKLSPPVKDVVSPEEFCFSAAGDTVNMKRVRETMEGEDEFEGSVCRKKQSILQNVSIRHSAPPTAKVSKQQRSILSFHKDSLEIIRSSNARYPTVKDYMRVYPEQRSKNSLDIPVTIPKTTKKLDVNFLQVAKLYQNLKAPDKPWKVYEREQKIPVPSPPKPKSKTYNNFLRKPNCATVVGRRSGEEHLDTTDKFTTHRIHSFIDILTQNPDLIRIFTTCNQ